MIFLTGASGKTGGELARLLCATGEAVRSLTRSEVSAVRLRGLGVEVMVGDGSERKVLAGALRGASVAALIYPNGPAQLGLERGFVDAAKAAGVSRVVKLSSIEALSHLTNPVHQGHYRSEEYLKASEVAWTMVRPSFFMQNFFGNAATIRAQAKFFLPMKNGRAAMTDTRDVAAFMAHVLTTASHEGQTYEITGPAVMSFADVAAAFSEALGRRIEYVNQDPAQYRAFLGQFVKNEWHLNAVCEIFREIAEGYETPATTTFADVLHREPTSFEQFVRDHAAVFGA